MHLLGGDVVVEQRLPVLQGRGVGKTADEVGVGMRVTRGGGEMARHVVRRCGGGGRKKCLSDRNEQIKVTQMLEQNKSRRNMKKTSTRLT